MNQIEKYFSFDLFVWVFIRDDSYDLKISRTAKVITLKLEIIWCFFWCSLDIKDTVLTVFYLKLYFLSLRRF